MFHLQANKVNLSVLERENVTTGSVNVYRVRFGFSADWDGLDKTAVFRVGSESRSVRLGQDGTCEIPWEILPHDAANRALYIGVYGVRDEAVVLPTVWANAGTILRGASPGEEAAPPTPGLYEQIVEQFRSMSEQTLTGAGEILAGAESAASKAKSSASSASQSASNAERSAQAASATLGEVQKAASTAAAEAAEQTAKALQGYLSNAQTAEQNAHQAEQDAVAAKETAVAAARDASRAALSAGTSATAAERLKDETFTAAQAAESAATVAQNSAQNAAESAEVVQLAQQDVSADREAAEEAADAAKTAQNGAQSAKTAAEKAAGQADADRQAIENLSVEARTLEAGSPATVEKQQEDEHVKLAFGLPRGERGESAYQQAVSAGLSATESEFNSALAKVVDAWSNWHYDLTDEEMSDPDIVYERTRPVDWLKLPDLDAVQDGEFWLLFQWLPEDTASCTFAITTTDGTTLEVGRFENGVFTKNEKYDMSYNKGSVTVKFSLDGSDFSDLTSEGKVQAVVRIRGAFTSIVQREDYAKFVDGIVKAQDLKTLGFGLASTSSRTASDMAYFAIAGISDQAESISFRQNTKLVAVRGVADGFNSVSYPNYMFAECYKLLALPKEITFAEVTRFQIMFTRCYSLKALPKHVTFASLYNVDNTGGSSGLLLECRSLRELPQDMTLKNLVSGTNFFNGCYSLQRLPDGMTFPALTNGSYMFHYCYALRELPNGMKFPALTNGNYMFYNCYALRELPDGMEFPALINGNYMFYGCYGLSAIESARFPNAVTLISMFQNSKIRRITGFYIPRCSSIKNAFSGCTELEAFTFSEDMETWETPDDLNLSGTQLSHAAILALFESLPTISTPKTLTLTSTPGASQVTAEEAQIATGKGWLLAGIPAASDAGAEGPEIFLESAAPDAERTELTDYIDRKIDEAFAARGF